MKIVFISAANLYLCPYIQKYLNVIKGNISYDIIYWDRHGIEEVYGAETLYRYRAEEDELTPRWKKLLGYFAFGRFCKKILKENQYDGVILLHTDCGVLLTGLLTRYYRDRFILDIRDYSFEKNPVYYAAEKRLVQASYANFISSDAYRDFLSPGEYYVVHNNCAISEETAEEFRSCRGTHSTIRISFIGLVRFFEQSEKMAHSFAEDSRFLLGFFGKNASRLEAVLKEKGYHSGLRFLDRFSPEETISLYRETDIINGAYGNHNISLDYAYSNKLYYAAALGMPILVSPATAMERITAQYGLGFVYDPDDPKIADKLYQYYREIDWPTFDQNCAAFRKMVEDDEKRFEAVVQAFVTSRPPSSN